MSLTQDSPADRVGTPVDGVDVLGALSPSRASDFTTCPLLYRFRTIDKLPEPPSVEAVRGTVVHLVLERLFDLPAAERTLPRAVALLEPAWADLRVEAPDLAGMFLDAGAEAHWLASCRAALAAYFSLEDPRRLEPAEREMYVETVLASRLLLRGYVDRLDRAPDGAVRVVDYKSSKAPPPDFEARALFQLKCYALALWRTEGRLPAMLQLIYLGSEEILRYEPDEQDLLATERKVDAIWAAIRAAEESGEWLPNRSPMCRWCAHQALCPEFGGTPPPLPVKAVDR